MDVLGLPLEEARWRLSAAGHETILEQRTAPPRGRLPEGVVRVVQQRLTAAGEPLLVTAAFPAVPPAEPGDAPEGVCRA